jgi:hypothetical protein
LMEKIQSRKDIENPIGYITAVLKATKANGESQQPEPMFQDQMILPYLISYFKRSKKPLSNWFVADLAIEELQKHFSMEPEEAKAKFEGIKEELYQVLGITVSVNKTKAEIEKQQQEIEDLLKKLRLESTV